MSDDTTVAPAGKGDEQEQYGEYYYRHDCGLPYERNEYWLGLLRQGRRPDRQRPASDSRCSTQAARRDSWSRRCAARGVEAYGIDVSEYAIGKVDESVAEYCQVGSLTEPLPRRYDLITCVEVVEHIPAEEAETVIATLCAATDRLLLSTRPTTTPRSTHLNVQPPEYWSKLLAREGFFRVVDLDLSYLTPWAALYTRREETPVGLVGEYDGSWCRLRREVIEVRRALLAKQEELVARSS